MQSFQEQDYTKRFDLSLWRKLIKVAKPYHKNLIAVVLFMAVSAIIDVIMPNMNAYAIDVFIANHSTAGLVGFVVAYALLTAVQVATIFGFLRQCGIVETGTCYLIRKLGFQKLQELPFSYYDRMPVGYLMSRLTNDTQRLADTIGWSLVDLCWGAVYLVACAVRMLTINWRLGLIVMLVLPPLAVISWKFQKAILAAYRQVRKNNSQITAGFNEGINGAKTTKTLVREELNIQEFETVSASMRSASIRAATLSNLFLPIVVSLGSLATAYALWQGGNSVIGGTHVFGVAMTVGTLTMFINYTVSFFQPVRDIARIFAELQSAQAAAERVISLLETEPDIVDSPEVVAQYGDNFHPKTENWPKLIGDIDFEDVTFRYKEGEKVLEHFNLHIQHGQTIALVGETGSGKSTITKLLLKYYEPESGTISVGGVDLDEYSNASVRRAIAYVPQNVELFSKTIYDNIRVSRMDATMDEVKEAAKKADAHDFIRHLPLQYNTYLEEAGNGLSGGEKQRIALARAFLKDSNLYILDESTSNLDFATENLIFNMIYDQLADRSMLIVAHRLSTVRDCDMILVMDHGQIVERGTHDELLAKQGAYSRLYLHNTASEKWQFLNSYKDGVITADTAGRYLLTNQNLRFGDINWTFFIAGGVVVILIAIAYIVLKKRYWFW